MRTALEPERVERRSDRRTAAVVSGVLVVVAVCALWGTWLDRNRGIHLDAAPLFGWWEPRFAVAALVAVAVAAVVVRCETSAGATLPFSRLLIVSFVAALCWGVALALVDGRQGLESGITGPHGFLTVVDRVEGPGEFIDTFTDHIAGYTVHVRGHPPALVAVLWWLGRAGLGSTGIAAIVIVCGASIVPGVLIAAREVAGSDVARRAAPFLVLAPAAIWLVTSFDALYAAVAAWGIACLALAGTRRVPSGDALALTGGVLLGFGLFLTYGIALLVAMPLAIVIWHRRWRALVLAGAGVGLVVAVFAMLGFWWPEGLRATHAEYLKGIGGLRPYGYFVIANLAAFAIAIGPGAVAGLAHLRDRRLWILVGAAWLGVAAADVSGFSKGEVERIWLIFWPWVALAAAALPVTSRRWWLAGQAAFVIALHILVFTPW